MTNRDLSSVLAEAGWPKELCDLFGHFRLTAVTYAPAALAAIRDAIETEFPAVESRQAP